MKFLKFIKSSPKAYYRHYIRNNRSECLGSIERRGGYTLYYPEMSPMDREPLHLSAGCLREVADFMDSLDNKENSPSASANTQSKAINPDCSECSHKQVCPIWGIRQNSGIDISVNVCIYYSG